MCAKARCDEEIIILTWEMKLCYLGYRSRAMSWEEKGTDMRHSSAHVSIAEEFASSWRDMAAYAKQQFNLCFGGVISDSLHS